MIVKLDLDRVYPIEFDEGTVSSGFFTTTLQDGSKEKIKIDVSEERHESYDNVYPLAFGPIDEEGNIKSFKSVAHADHSLVFSTILHFSRCYLEAYPDRILGMDGSTNSRTWLYYRMIHQNYDYLARYFDNSGIKHYVRISRIGKRDDENPFDFNDMKSMAIDIKKEEYLKFIHQQQMFNYFIFELKK